MYSVPQTVYVSRLPAPLPSSATLVIIMQIKYAYDDDEYKPVWPIN